MATPPLLDCAPPHLAVCPDPADGARHPGLGLMAHADSTHSDHDYESLPSSFDQLRLPQDTSVYAHIEPAEEDEADSPPYVPENSELVPDVMKHSLTGAMPAGQRVHMLKIDSQGYALVMSDGGEEAQQPQTPDPGPGYFQLTPTHSATWPAIPCDYEVPVPARTSSSSTYTSSLPPIPSPGHPHTSPGHPHTPPVHLHIPPLTRQAALTTPPDGSRGSDRPHIMPRRSSAEEEREAKRDSVSSHHPSSRFSTASSGQGENRDSVFESSSEVVREQQEQEGGEGGEMAELEKAGKKREDEGVGSREQVGKQQRRRKIYEVENRVRTKSYPDPFQKPWTENGTRRKYRSMRMLISFNEESQTVV